MALLAALLIGPCEASAETLRSALDRAFRTNPRIQAMHAAFSASRANVARVQAGYFPKLKSTADFGWSDTLDHASPGADTRTRLNPHGAGMEMTQNIFNGGRTLHGVRQADALALATSEQLRDMQQAVLLDAVVAYMDVLRDRDILELERQYHHFLLEQGKFVQGLFRFGDVTQTDVAQVQARIAANRARVSLAEANLHGSRAVYTQIVGSEPKELAAAKPLDELAPASLAAAVDLALQRNPAILAASHAVTAAQAQVRTATGDLLPSFDVTGSLSRRNDHTVEGDRRTVGALVGRLSVPILDGGETPARIREARDIAARRQHESDAARTQARAAVATAWSQFHAAKARLVATREQMRASTAALKGVQAEFAVGQRTTSNMLDAVEDVVSAGVNLISVERERVVSSFALARATGRLDEQAIAAASAGARAPRQSLFAQFKPGRLALRRLPNLDTAALRRGYPAECESGCEQTGHVRISLRRGFEGEEKMALRPSLVQEFHLRR